ncbi:MAG: DinB family protein, partial [Longimicrobiales bacterium]
FGAIAHVWSTYESRVGSLESDPVGRGINSVHLLHQNGRWRITSLVFQIERGTEGIPGRYLPSDSPSVGTPAAWTHPTVPALVEDIEEARIRLLDLVEGLSSSAVEAPVEPDRWSPLQYVEHLVRAEEATLWRMFTAVEDGRRGRPGPESSTPDESIEQVTDRTWGEPVEAPPLAVPAWTGSGSYWLERLRRSSALVARFADLVDDAELDSIAYNHPISGPFTMRQGLEFIRFHIDRHHNHIVNGILSRTESGA